MLHEPEQEEPLVAGERIHYEGLSNAIVAQATSDYRAALRLLARRPSHRGARLRMEELEEFFHSDWFALLTSLSPEVLLEKLAKEA